jgi:hypothetical protein
MINTKDAARFWSKVEKLDSGCWKYTGCCGEDGHGRFQFKNRSVCAHRFSWELAHGKPAEDLVLHRCDFPACVNPAHLFGGSHADNVADRVAKGRSATGARNGRAKLKPKDVQYIKKAFAGSNPPSLASLARKFGVSDRAISFIRNGEKWKSIPT